MGARIGGAGSPTIVVDGVKELHGTKHEVIPDRIEAISLMIAAAITRGDVTITRCRPDHMSAAIDTLKEMGAKVTHGKDWVRVVCTRRLRAVDITTLPYPGVPTDAQAQFMALLSVANGTSVVTEKVFPDRFMHVAEMNRMGANIRKEGAAAMVVGVPKLSGAPVMASDLRASAGLVLAALAAKGESEMRRVYHLDRGYEHFEDKLNSLGARIRREPDNGNGAEED
jgi:UDP-N-acetylglucosamine 1-carboxyvinyltransferase